MHFAQTIRMLATRRHEAVEVDAAAIEALLAAIFDGGIDDLELGAGLVAMHGEAVEAADIVGGLHAMNARVQSLRCPDVPYRPLVFSASTPAVRTVPNLLPWLVLVLSRLGVPVLVHGDLGGTAGASTACVLRGLGVMPNSTLAKTQTALEERRIAFVPVGLLSPGLANLLAAQTRLGLKNWTSKLAALIDPFRGGGVRIIGVADGRLREIIESTCCDEELDALVFEGADDDAFVAPFCRPRLTGISGGARSMLFAAESSDLEWRVSLPEPDCVASCVTWTRRALAGDAAVPHPMVNQLACCLFLCGYAADMNQAKAIAAMESGALLTGMSRLEQDNDRRLVE